MLNMCITALYYIVFHHHVPAAKAKIEDVEEKPAKEEKPKPKPKGRARGKAAAAAEHAEDESQESADSQEAASDAEPTSTEGKPEVNVEMEACKSWRVFLKNARELGDKLQSSIPDVKFNFTYNKTPPRRGAFEIVVHKSDGSEQLIWTGLKKGPPRKLKFPDIATLESLVRNEIL